LIKVFSSKNKEPTSKKDDDYYKDSKDKKSQDMIDTNVESDVNCDSSMNINIKKEVEISKLVKKMEMMRIKTINKKLKQNRQMYHVQNSSNKPFN